MGETKTILIVANGAAIDAPLFAADAVVSPTGDAVVWASTGDRLPAAEGTRFVDQPEAAVGWLLQGGVLVAPPAPPEPEPAVPAAVSSAQAKIALLRAPPKKGGATLLADVKAAIAAETTGEVAIWFDDERTWRRDNRYVALLGAALGLSDEQIDDLFIEAALIQA